MAETSQTRIVLKKGDITKETVDVIVNAANSSLMGGSGVDGAIHKAGGPAILQECIKIRDRQGPCATGQAVITTGGKLKARYVVHTVGPVWRGGNSGEATALRQCYINCLATAGAVGAKTIAFPAISTGAYGFPISHAASVAFQAIKEFISFDHSFEEIRFILYSQYDLLMHQEALNNIELYNDK